MKAAVVQSFDHAPVLTDFPHPIPESNEVLIRVEAAALSQLAIAQASGRHYSSASVPFVPGADGVGRLEDGQRVYFAFPRAPWGAMAEFTTVHRDLVVPLPAEVDPLTIAAIANPAMSSWAALRERAGFKAGESVLINGANGTSGRLAIRIARILGARRVIAVARNRDARAELEALGANAFIALSQAPEQVVAEIAREAERGIDVVLDYLCGTPAEYILQALMAQAKASEPRAVRFVNIGSLAGPSMSLAAAALRSTRIELMGSGLGSLDRRTLVKSVAGVIEAARSNRLPIESISAPIAELQAHWKADPGPRVVFTF